MVSRHCSIKLCTNTTTKADVNCTRVVHLESKKRGFVEQVQEEASRSAFITATRSWSRGRMARPLETKHEAVADPR